MTKSINNEFTIEFTKLNKEQIRQQISEIIKGTHGVKEIRIFTDVVSSNRGKFSSVLVVLDGKKMMYKREWFADDDFFPMKNSLPPNLLMMLSGRLWNWAIWILWLTQVK